MEAIAEKLSTEEYDIISLQEVWSIDDFQMIKTKVQEKLPYSHYFHRYLTNIFELKFLYLIVHIFNV